MGDKKVEDKKVEANKSEEKKVEIIENALRQTQKELEALKRDYKTLVELTPTDVMAEGLVFKVEKLSTYSQTDLLDDNDTLDEFIEEAQALVKTSKHLSKLLNE